ncbi:uncharacterized protein ELE39_003282 [Cryptosporidium sp. chipmunk genotype I]|uniref:uncharacterized protein n=1 Tax=Cryptosporidium sp. chipmunk genotype I TaxID=1280935 RepID=UPI00351A1661|nr:secreted protein [Cryptosporidium sp. chipmunk genotype I]
MKNKQIFLNVLAIFVFLLAIIIEGAEFNEENNSEEKTNQIQEGVLNQESLALLSLISNTYERNCVVDTLTKLLFSYSAILLKFSYFFNENVLHEQIKRLKEVIFHADIKSFFINKSFLIRNEKLECLYSSCFDYLKYDHINQLNYESMNEQYIFIMNIVENHTEILKPIRESQVLLEYLISFDLDLSLKLMASVLINYVSEFISLLEESVKSYKKMNKRNFRKLFDSRKDFLSRANINLRISNQKLENLMKMKVNFEKNKKFIGEYNKFLENPDQKLTEEVSHLRKLYSDYYENNECTEEQILEMEFLLSTSMELLGLISVNILYFNKRKLSENIKFIESNIFEINKKVTMRATETNVSENVSFSIKKNIMNKLEYDKVLSFDILSSKFSNKLSGELIIKNFKTLYLCLLRILKILKKESQLNKCGKYIQELISQVISTYEYIGRECATSLKSYEECENLTILPFETIRVIRESNISKFRQIITEQVEKKKEKIREEKEKLEKLEMEKKEQLEKEISEYKKKREKLKEKNKSKQKKIFPEAKDDIKNVQEKRNDSTVTPTIFQATKSTVRHKAERRKKLVEDLIRFNEESIRKEQIREAVNSQKFTKKSKKKTDQDEREKCATQAKGQIKYDNIPENDLDKDYFNESGSEEESCLFEDKEKKYARKTNVSKFLLPVIKIVEESIQESNQLHNSSQDETADEKLEGACSTYLSGKKVYKKRLANEKPSDTPLVKSTLELIGKSFFFEKRDICQRDTAGRGKERSCSGEISKNPLPASQKGLSDKQFRKKSVFETRKSRSKAKRNVGPVRRASSEPPPKNGSSSNLKTRSSSIPKVRTRSRSRSRSRSRIKKSSKSRSKLNLKPEICSDEEFDEMVSNLFSKFMCLEKKMSQFVDNSPQNKSRFIPMFSESKVTEAAQSIDIFSFFNIVDLDFLNITENSTKEEIEASIELCSGEITRIHVEILPLLTGHDLFQMKSFQKSLISQLIRLLIIFNNKKNG